MFDYILRNGLVHDGLGSVPVKADIGVAGGAIKAIGNLAGSEGQAIECDGYVVSPGFIDIHTHSDETLVVDPDGYSMLMQGVTTEIVGNCGFSCAPCASANRLSNYKVGDASKPPERWRSFDDYLNVLQRLQPGLNVAAYVGHNTIRTEVMGAQSRAAEEGDLAVMTAQAREALEQGAIGVSSGLEYHPGFNADLNELVAIAKVAAEYDSMYATHVRNRDWHYEMGVGEALATARLSGVRLQISHLVPKYGAPPHAAEHIMEMMDWTKRQGVDVGFDVIPHEWGPTRVASVLPKWAYEGGVERTIERLRDPQLRPRLKYNPFPQWKMVADRRWYDIILTQSVVNSGLIGLDFEEIGRIRGCDPHDAVLDLLLEEMQEKGTINALYWMGRISREDDIKTMLRDPECAVISDTMTLNVTGPLAGLSFTPSGFGWTARFLRHYSRDEGLFPLAEAIRRLTSLPANRFNLKARGAIKVGYHADLVVFDAATLSDQSTLQEMTISPAGLLHVFVNGEQAVRSGQRTSVRSGRVLRRN